MDYKVIENGILVKDARDFEPEHIFECGQCFRWNKESDGSYRGVAGGRILGVKKRGGDILLDGAGEKEFREYWARYFDLETTVKSNRHYPRPGVRAVEFGSGIRILKQDTWETLSRVISANNRIRDKDNHRRLCRCFGVKKQRGSIFDFPPPGACRGWISRIYAPAAAVSGQVRAWGCKNGGGRKGGPCIAGRMSGGKALLSFPV